MNTISASEAKTHFGALIDRVQHEPVTIQKQGRPVAVMVSFESYEPQSKPEEKKAALDFLSRWTAKPASDNLEQKLKGDVRAQAILDKYEKA